jgi:S1-C subfamily serine protease
LARRLSFVHLSGPRRGAVDEVPLPTDVGSAEESPVKVPGIAPSHCHVFERDGDVVLRDGGSEAGTLLAGEPVHEAVLRDGDVLELGSGGPKLRLRDESEKKRIPLGKALAWSRPESPHLSDAGFLARALLHETHVRTSPIFRWAVAFVLAAGGAVLGWSQWQASLMREELVRLRQDMQNAEQERLTFYARIEDERRKADRDRSLLEGQIEDLRQREGALKAQLGEATAGQVAAVRNDLAQTRVRLQNLESERAVGERIIREYGPGVALIQGSYAFYDKSSRPLRYRMDDDDRIVRDDSGAPVLDHAGTGSVHNVEYFGTGFLVDKKGLVLTNRHVAEPWWNDASAQLQIDKGYSPRFTSFRAFFPQEAEPFELEVERLSETTDLAVLRMETKGHKIPVLPLDRSGTGAVAGHPVVVVGYPAGLEAILAKQEGTVVKELLAGSGTSTERVTEALSKKGLIRPSTTQGHIGDITKSDIVFDAPTTQGGSGGPILNRNGEVIAVEYAVLSKFGGNSFGVPIHYAIELLKPPKPSR